MELLLFWILFAVCCGILANNKNRNVVGWAIGGFFFGIFALLIIACLPKLEE